MFGKSYLIKILTKANKNSSKLLLILILQEVRKSPGITAKRIGQRVRLSTYLSLLYAMDLVKLELLTYREAFLGEEQENKAYLFYPLINGCSYKVDCNNKVAVLQEQLSTNSFHFPETCRNLLKFQKSELCNMNSDNHADLSHVSKHEVNTKTDRVRDLSARMTSQVMERLRNTESRQLSRMTEKPIYNQQVIDLLTQNLTKLTTVCEQQGIQVRSIESRLNEQERRTEAIEAKLDALTLNGTSNYYTIRGYCNINRIKVSQKEAQSLGTQASKICRQKGCLVKKIPDERHGEVNTYPVEVLDNVLELYKNRVS
ncbi:hypothetical protein [Nostoc sp.]|uniref:hypothetical protein n=1 Tax=Nostoc sp. TaxID=1180 RepID=UPI002FF482FE